MRVFCPIKISRLLQATGHETMETTLQRRRWKWLGHVLRMEPTAHARTALTCTPEKEGKGGVQEQHGGDEECWYWLGECLKS